jgi:hypothetical protein
MNYSIPTCKSHFADQYYPFPSSKYLAKKNIQLNHIVPLVPIYCVAMLSDM